MWTVVTEVAQGKLKPWRSWCVMFSLTFRRIQGSIKDEKKKKFVTGEWFSEVKAKRFQEDLEGPDLLRASIRKKKGKLESKYVSVHLKKTLMDLKNVGKYEGLPLLGTCWGPAFVL